MLAACHLAENLLPAGVQQHAVERAVDNGDDGYKNFLALDLQKIEDQGEADEAAFPRTQSAAHHNHQNKEVDDQLFAPCELTVRRITDHNVCKGNHGNYHGNDAQDHLFDHCQSVHNFLIDFHFTIPFCFFAGLTHGRRCSTIDPLSGTSHHTPFFARSSGSISAARRMMPPMADNRLWSMVSNRAASPAASHRTAANRCTLFQRSPS